MNSQSSGVSKKPPIFIFGSARSGTSLLSRIVGSHPNIAVPFESQLYNTFYPWLKYYGDLKEEKNRRRLVRDMLYTKDLLDWTPRPYAKTTFSAITRFDFHGIVDALITEWAKQSGKQRWGEKTPWHIFFWREILEGFPDMKIVHIVRDGRDASLSWKNARFGPKHIYHLARKWRHYLEQVDDMKQALGEDRIFELRYEDLLDDPEGITKRLCAFIDETFSEDMLSFYHEKVPYPTDKQNMSNLTRPLIRSNKEKWRKAMSERETRIFEAVCGGFLKKYRYDCVHESPRISGLEKWTMNYLEHPPKRIWSMLKNTKGQKDALRLKYIYFRLRLGA